MGYGTAIGMAQAGLPLEGKLAWHLQYNHFPPVPVEMIPACVAAIEAAQDEDYDREIKLPEDVTYRGATTAPASAIVGWVHLDAFLTEEDES